MDHEYGRPGIPSKLGARMQIARDRACPGPAPLRMEGVRVHEQGPQAYRERQAHVWLTAPAAGKGTEKAQAPQEDHRNAGRHVLPPHVEELQGGAREARPDPRRAGVHMPGQEARQKLAHDDGSSTRRTRPSRLRRPPATGRAARCRTT